MTTKRYYKLTPSMMQNAHDILPVAESWPINNHPALRYTRKNARKIRRLRQCFKGKKYATVVYLVTFL